MCKTTIKAVEVLSSEFIVYVYRGMPLHTFSKEGSSNELDSYALKDVIVDGLGEGQCCHIQ